jgi:hypothetical protein
VIFRSSLEAPFGELLKSITRAAEEVEKSATAEHMTRSEGTCNPAILAEAAYQTIDLMQRMLRKGLYPVQLCIIGLNSPVIRKPEFITYPTP